jgi:hypothetical protein
MPALHFGVTVLQTKRAWEGSRHAALEQECRGWDSGSHSSELAEDMTGSWGRAGERGQAASR